MPYDWVEPEIYLEYKGLKVYHIYDDDMIQDGAREYWYGLSSLSSDDCGHGTDGCFDVRDLPNPAKHKTNTDAGRKAIIRAAIDSGYFNDWDWPGKDDPEGAAPAVVVQVDESCEIIEGEARVVTPGQEDPVERLVRIAGQLELSAQDVAYKLHIESDRLHGGGLAEVFKLALEDGDYHDWIYEVLTDGRDVSTVPCKFCHQRVSAKTAHPHQGEWVGECCWDERLRASE